VSGREVPEPCVHANVAVGEVLEPYVRDNVVVGEVSKPCVRDNVAVGEEPSLPVTRVNQMGRRSCSLVA
jgi:hypothetical protein